MRKKVLVIGAGFGGLSASAILGKEGFDVTVFEKNAMPGGRAMQIKEKGYTFDMGPSWYLMPEAFERFFAEFSKKPSDYYSLKKLSPSYRVYFGSNRAFDVSDNIADVYKLFDSFEDSGGKKLKQFLQIAGKRYEKALEKFLYRDYQSIKDILDIELLKEVFTAGLFNSLDSHVKYYFSSEEAQKILLFTIVFLDISPKRAPSLYSMLAYADLEKKVWYPKGGIYSVVKAFEKIAKEHNVTFFYNKNVSKIITKNGKATGVVVDGKTINADVVVSNADYAFTELKLLDKKSRTLDSRYWSKKTIAQSAFCIYLGVNKKIKNLKHHTLFVGSNWDTNFSEIFDNPIWPTDPSYYICTPSKTDPSVAPRSSENIFILVPIAPGLSDTPKIRKKYSEKIINHLEKLLNQDIANSIEYKKIITLKDYKSLYNAYEGTAFGLAHTLFQTALFRPYVKSKKLTNLYYTGAYTHPGVGMPTSIISGQLAARKIIKDAK